MKAGSRWIKQTGFLFRQIEKISTLSQGQFFLRPIILDSGFIHYNPSAFLFLMRPQALPIFHINKGPGQLKKKLLLL